TATDPGMLRSTLTLRSGSVTRQIDVVALVVSSAISVQPLVGFGEVAVGGTREAKVPITNLLTQKVSVTASVSEGAFSTTAQAPVEIEPRGVAEIDVQFAPACVGDVGGTLVLSTCAGCADVSVTLQGKATGSAFSVTPGLLEFPSTA